MRKKILLLGSGELGKELVIACQRLGQHVIAVDSYEGAPAMQVAHEFEVVDMLDGNALDQLVEKHQPDIIVPEIEAIRTERFYNYEAKGIQVVPSAKAANFTMNRKAIRDLAAKEVGVKTAPYQYATSLEELKQGVAFCGMPCVVKPLMSSSGKGQSVIKSEDDIERAWNYALEGSRGDLKEVIVEGFIDFDYEITLLTLTQNEGNTLFCAPIGHRQERGDYQESWQPMPMKKEDIKVAQEMAAAVTKALGGSGIWGVEFFIAKDGVYFSELSPRPHDTGMVTLGNTQNFSEFELHARAIIGIPVKEIVQEKNGASAVVLADKEILTWPTFKGLEKVSLFPKSDIRLFGKPTARPYRRMGVVLTFGDEEVIDLVDKAKSLASMIEIQ
ncbi:MAG: formate-dependent phosphoribosylglycinamide formyltransferase [Crocinitomicaceae bacterium]